MMPTADVPCNGCTLCCQNDAVRLLPGDDASQYRTEPHPFFAGALMLAHKSTGECLYLTAAGCGIHAIRPRMCREMDCRNIAQAFTWSKAWKLAATGLLPMAIWRRGKELLR